MGKQVFTILYKPIESVWFMRGCWFFITRVADAFSTYAELIIRCFFVEIYVMRTDFFCVYILIVFCEERMAGTAVYSGAGAGYVVAGAAGCRQGFCDAPRWRTTQQPLWCARCGTGTRAPKISRRPATRNKINSMGKWDRIPMKTFFYNTYSKFFTN